MHQILDLTLPEDVEGEIIISYSEEDSEGEMVVETMWEGEEAEPKIGLWTDDTTLSLDVSVSPIH